MDLYTLWSEINLTHINQIKVYCPFYLYIFANTHINIA